VVKPDGQVSDYWPVWSPDGSQIAFRSYRDGDGEVYTMSADGTGPRRLTNSPGQDFAVSWSPDGSKIAFTSDRDGDSEVYIMNSADGSDVVNLTDNPAYENSGYWRP
jgi:TolB protein